MLKRSLTLTLTACLFFLILPTLDARAIAPEPATAVVAAEPVVPIFQYADNGLVTIQYNVKTDVKTKLLVQKDEEKRFYDLRYGQPAETFPLQLGNGQYQISILENLTDNQYKVVLKDTYTLDLDNPLNVFLGSIQNVNWDASMSLAAVALELTADATSDLEKVSKVHQFVIEHLEYDEAKAANPPANYLPNLTTILEQGTGICYDYAAMFAGMLRSLDIPTKLVMGDSTFVEQYHAWNEVYIEETGEWLTIDPTVDASWLRSNVAFEMIKNKTDYVSKFEY